MPGLLPVLVDATHHFPYRHTTPLPTTRLHHCLTTCRFMELPYPTCHPVDHLTHRMPVPRPTRLLVDIRLTTLLLRGWWCWVWRSIWRVLCRPAALRPLPLAGLFPHTYYTPAAFAMHTYPPATHTTHLPACHTHTRLPHTLHTCFCLPRLPAAAHAHHTRAPPPTYPAIHAAATQTRHITPAVPTFALGRSFALHGLMTPYRLLPHLPTRTCHSPGLIGGSVVPVGEPCAVRHSARPILPTSPSYISDHYIPG